MELLRLLAALVLFLASLIRAQAAIDPSGHWEGAVQIPNMEMKIEIDLTKNDNGEIAGTFGQPAEGVKGLPLSTVSVDGRTVRFVFKGGDGPATFAGALSADGQSIAGEVNQGTYTVPFKLARTGDARIARPPKSASIGKQLEGTWSGVLEADGRQMRLVLKMANQPDGTASGTIMSPDGSGVEIPIAMTQKGSTLIIDVTQVGSGYVGVLNEAGTELVGTYTQGPVTAPLTFKREIKR